MIFDDIKHSDKQGKEYWSARELATALEYKEWRNFKPVIEKAMELCKQNAVRQDDHFVVQHEMITLAKGAKRGVDSFRLSRYACVLIAMRIKEKKTMAMLA